MALAPLPVLLARRASKAGDYHLKPPHMPHHQHPIAHRPLTLGRTTLPLPRAKNLRSHLAQLIGRNWARVGYAYHVEPTWLEVNQIELPIRDLCKSLHGLKIAHMTDFHCGDQIPAGYLETALERTLAEKPDVIALTGDFIHKEYRHIAAAAKLFR